MRGHEKVRIAGLLTLSATASGALLGFVAGVIALAVPDAGLEVAVVLVAAAVVLDLLGRPRPLQVGRQVPQAWSRIFEPSVVAVLYGSRLGVGPLTVLPTWLWWAAMLVGALAGVLPAVLVGAAFAVTRVLAMVLVGEWGKAESARRLPRLWAVESLVHRTAGLSALIFAVALLTLR